MERRVHEPQQCLTCSRHNRKLHLAATMTDYRSRRTHTGWDEWPMRRPSLVLRRSSRTQMVTDSVWLEKMYAAHCPPTPVVVSVTQINQLALGHLYWPVLR